jgi:hypothetical protein
MFKKYLLIKNRHLTLIFNQIKQKKNNNISQIIILKKKKKN